MANWIKAIYFVVILAWVIYALSDDAVKYKSFPRRFGLSVALTVIIGLAGFALWHAAVPTSIKLLSEDSEVAESHSLASTTGSVKERVMAMSVKHIFLETMFDDFTPDSVSREELISILLDDLMVVARDNLSIEYLENGGDAEEALKLFSVEMRKNLEERIIA